MDIEERARVRPSIVDGIFYPQRQERLHSAVEDLLHHASVPAGEAFGIVCPHAGFRYSGHLAATSFKAASRREIRTVVFLGPIHRDPVDGIVLPESQYFQTPLGDLPVNETALRDFQACAPWAIRDDIPHLEEHCLEVQMPFVQVLFPNANILPILMGKATRENVQNLTDALRLTFAQAQEYTLFVVSANLTSYERGADAEAEASLFVRLIEERDWLGIVEGHAHGKISSCGAGCVAVLLLLGGSQMRVQILGHGSSASANGDRGHTVHYASVALRRDQPEA